LAALAALPALAVLAAAMVGPKKMLKRGMKNRMKATMTKTLSFSCLRYVQLRPLPP
jgi:uncharacterized membrane protein YqgA involved in biofilm formation